jgi:hypothetical protein
MAPFNGMRAGVTEFSGGDVEESAQRHGYGISTLVKFLVGKYGQEILVNIYDQIRENEKEPVEAILTSVPSLEYVWWPEFFKKYIAGEIYGVKSETFLNNISQQNKFSIDDATDTVGYFDNSYPDLSAELHRIDLVYDGFSDDAVLNFKVGPSSLNLDYVTVMVFGLKDEKLEYLGEGADLTLTDGYNDLKANDYNTLVAAVINSANESPYTGDLNIQLDVRVITPAEWQYKYVNINLDEFVGTWDRSDGEPYTDRAEFSHTRAPGTLIGNAFAGSWDTTYWSGSVAKYRHIGNLTIYIDNQSLEVTSFSAVDTTVYWYYYEADSYDSSVTASSAIGGDIPLVYQDEWYLKCWVTGTDACNHISSFTYKKEERNSYGDEYWRELSSFQCSEDSRIRIEFRSVEW